jgi:hypothetical protein
VWWFRTRLFVKGLRACGNDSALQLEDQKKEIDFPYIFSLLMPGAGAGLEPLTIGVMRYLFFHYATTTGHKKEIYIFSLSQHLGKRQDFNP